MSSTIALLFLNDAGRPFVPTVGERREWIFVRLPTLPGRIYPILKSKLERPPLANYGIGIVCFEECDVTTEFDEGSHGDIRGPIPKHCWLVSNAPAWIRLNLELAHETHRPITAWDDAMHHEAIRNRLWESTPAIWKVISQVEPPKRKQLEAIAAWQNAIARLQKAKGNPVKMPDRVDAFLSAKAFTEGTAQELETAEQYLRRNDKTYMLDGATIDFGLYPFNVVT